MSIEKERAKILYKKELAQKQVELWDKKIKRLRAQIIGLQKESEVFEIELFNLTKELEALDAPPTETKDAPMPTLDNEPPYFPEDAAIHNL